ncbi:MAG TPA: hypothetical protein VK966_05035, partial [Longimicrobiales bacterium]|nr:hypothetical protein [Longimicrobiales bacterium]
KLNWDRLLKRVGSHWRLLLSQLHFFDYVYPDHRDRIPDAVRQELHGRVTRALAGEEDLERAGATVALEGGTGEEVPQGPLCRGTLLSLFSFAIDVNEWGFRDERRQHVAALRSMPVVEEIRNAEVWRG